MSIGSLFAGIGGLELGLEWAGLGPTLWQVEMNRDARLVLARHWPHARRLSHVEAVPAAALPVPDVLCGGFPCQDLSQANPDGAGLDGERSGLFWRFLDCIDALDPPVVVIENVGRLAGRGLDIVVEQLERRGREVEATRMWASDVGAPHRRERLFIVAYAHRWLVQRRGIDGELAGAQRTAAGKGVQRERHGDAAGGGGARRLADPDRRRQRFERVEEPGHEQGSRGHVAVRRNGARLGDPGSIGREGLDEAGAPPPLAVGPNGARRAGQAKPHVGGVPDGVSGRLDAAIWPAPRGAPRHDWEPPVLTRPGEPGRRARLRMTGNAVVPHCAYVVGLRIRQRVPFLTR